MSDCSGTDCKHSSHGLFVLDGAPLSLPAEPFELYGVKINKTEVRAVDMIRLSCRYKRPNGGTCGYYVQADATMEAWAEGILKNHIDKLHPDRALAGEAPTKVNGVAPESVTLKEKGASDGTADSSGVQERAEEDRGEAGRLAEERRGDPGGEEPGRFRRGEG